MRAPSRLLLLGGPRISTLRPMTSGASSRRQLVTTAAVSQDRVRLTRVLAQRRTESAAFFSRTAGEWDAVRDDLYGSTFHLDGLLAALRPVVDGGRPRVRHRAGPRRRWRRSFARSIAVDASAEMLTAARERLQAVRQRRRAARRRSRRLPVADGDRRSARCSSWCCITSPIPRPCCEEARRVLAAGRAG